MKILVTGLCTLHWGRLQYGNIGNYYIIDSLFKQLHKKFVNAEIVTTFQMTEEFQEEHNIKVLPMELYYSWKENDLEQARYEYELVKNKSSIKTKYIKEILETDIVINVSGDMWGDNAEHVGRDRFQVDLYKMRVAQILGVKTVLFAVTPGPFENCRNIKFAQEVFSKFNLVINREDVSSLKMKKWGFESINEKNYACPAFLYEPQITSQDKNIIDRIFNEIGDDKKIVGLTIGGFNMPVGPYDMWPRENDQYDCFVKLIEYMVLQYNVKVVLISHTNGFELPPDFKLINGRDYVILEQLKNCVLKNRKINEDDILLLNGPFLPPVTKKIIGKFDFMVTGRVHASVAAVSQMVPTVFINYNEKVIKSDKMYAFSKLINMERLVCNPNDINDMKNKFDICFNNQTEIRKHLQEKIPSVKEKAEKAFEEIKKVI